MFKVVKNLGGFFYLNNKLVIVVLFLDVYFDEKLGRIFLDVFFFIYKLEGFLLVMLGS